MAGCDGGATNGDGHERLSSCGVICRPATGAVYTYGKLYWVDGLVLNALPAGTLEVTVN